jgi:hypothetical protein
LWDKAVRYLTEAGVKAYQRCANRASAALLEDALLALDHLPETRATVERAIDLRLLLRRALTPLAESARILSHLRVASPLA